MGYFMGRNKKITVYFLSLENYESIDVKLSLQGQLQENLKLKRLLNKFVLFCRIYL